MSNLAMKEMPAATEFSRGNPSPRYRELVALYQRMHVEGIPDQGIKPGNLFAGASIIPHLPMIKTMVMQTQSKSLLDYGSGKGLQYRATGITLRNGERIADIRSYLGVERIVCYDPGVREHATMPDEKFDGVVSTDVLEHCPEQDVAWILEEMFAAASKFLFANIASYPAAKTLPNGENAHCTVRPPEWWNEIILPIAEKYPHVVCKIDISKSYST
jgi:hypothetical protein